jgi:hypothetical protein
MVVNPGGRWWISRFIDQQAVLSTGKALPRFVKIDGPGSSAGKNRYPPQRRVPVIRKSWWV